MKELINREIRGEDDDWIPLSVHIRGGGKEHTQARETMKMETTNEWKKDLEWFKSNHNVSVEDLESAAKLTNCSPKNRLSRIRQNKWGSYGEELYGGGSCFGDIKRKEETMINENTRIKIRFEGG